MSNGPTNPGGSADLGSAMATVGFRVDRTGFTQYVRDANAILQIQQRVTQAQTQRLAQSQTQSVTRAEIQAQARVQASTIAGNARIEQQRLASVARVEAAEKAAASRVQAAQIDADRRVEAERIRAQNRIELAQRRQSSTGPILPRSVAGVTMQGALGLAGAFGIATTATAAVQQVSQLASESLSLANNLEDTRASIVAISGSAERGTEFFDLLTERSRVLGTNVQQTAAAFTPLVAGLREMPELFRLAVNQAERLALANKEQGQAGGAFALNEFLSSGETISIADRFNLPKTAFKELAEETRDITNVTEQYRLRLEGVDRILNNLGLTNEAVAASTRTASADFRLASAAITEYKTSVGQTAQVLLGPAARGLTNLLTGGRANSEMLQRQADIAALAATNYQDYAAGLDKIDRANRFVVGSQKELTEAQFEYLKSLPEAEQKTLLASGALTTITPAAIAAGQALSTVSRGAGVNADTIERARAVVQDFGALVPNVTLAVQNLAEAFSNGSIDGATFDQRLRELTTDAVALQRALDEQADAHERNAAAATKNQRALEGVKAGSDASMDAVTRGAQGIELANRQAEQRRAEALTNNQTALAQLVIASGEQIVDAEQRKDDALDQLEEGHTRTVERLVEQRTKTQIDAAKEIAKEEGKYLNDRADLIAENNERIDSLVSGHAQSEGRLLEDQQRADRRSQEDFNESQQEALEDYQDRRQELIDQQHAQEIESESDYQRELGSV